MRHRNERETFGIFHENSVFQLAGSDDVDLLNSDRLWKIGDEYDPQAYQAFQNVLYVSVHTQLQHRVQ